MIISRTPFRISFMGGGTDYPQWYNENGGNVLNVTINKYCYINCRYLPKFFKYKYLLRYFLREEVNNINKIKHPSIRECLKFLNVNNGIEMVYSSDIPAQSGIGSSSAFTVGFLNALYALRNIVVNKRRLALDAIHIEQNIIKENVGSQDQVAAAFGGLNKIEFDNEKKIIVKPVIINKERVKTIQNHFMLFFTGYSRNASEIAKEQIKRISQKKRELQIIMGMVDEMVNIFKGDVDKLDNIGRLLHESWKLKRELTPFISTTFIDEMYELAIKSGALGGKLIGSGGGGFMLFYVKPHNQDKLKKKLKELLYVPFKFEDEGSKIIYFGDIN